MISSGSNSWQGMKNLKTICSNFLLTAADFQINDVIASSVFGV
jgi:hypothetical protein